MNNYDLTPIDELDPMYYEAIKVVMDTGMVSASLLQRRLKLGYARAARVLDELEETGIVGPSNGAEPRKILVKNKQWSKDHQEMLQRLRITRYKNKVIQITKRVIKTLLWAVLFYCLKLLLGFEVAVIVALAIVVERVFGIFNY